MKNILVPFKITQRSEILPTFQKIVCSIHGQLYQDLLTAFTEGVANAILHAKELQRLSGVKGSIYLGNKKILIRIEDHGRGFELNRVPLPRFTYLSQSGRGVFMMRQLMDQVTYRKGKNKNCLILERDLPGSDQAKDLELLYEISNAILETRDMEAVYQIILDKTLQIFNVDKASILTYDKKTNRLRVIASRGLTEALKKAIQVRPGEGIAGYVFQHAKGCLIENMEKNPSGWKKKKRYKSKSFISAPMICSPMRLGQESVGVINLTDRRDGRPFTRRDLRLLTTIANQATAYLHISRLMREAEESKQLQKEMKLARQIQQSYLPKSPPEFKGLKLAGWCETAQATGGDYYDFIVKDDNHLFVLVADVSGHDMKATMTMVTLRGLIRSTVIKETNPGRILQKINREIFSDLVAQDQFISLVLMHYQRKPRRLEVANAGHRSPLRIGQEIHPILKASQAGAVLGCLENESYKTYAIDLKKGESIFLYTDGITEAASSTGTRFGYARLVNILETRKDALTFLPQALKRFRSGAPVSDDMTAVSVRVV